MINIISCGTCKNNPQNKNRDTEKCEPCLNEWIKTEGRRFPNWEDNLSLYTKGVNHGRKKEQRRKKAFVQNKGRS